MRLAIITDELGQDPETVFPAVRQLGFDGVEIRSLDDTPPHQLTDVQLTKVRGLAARYGLSVAGLCPPVFKCPVPVSDADLRAARTVLEDSLRTAAALGAPHMRIFTFYRDGAPAPRAAAPRVAELLSGIDTAGVDLLVETGTRTNTPTIDHTLQFLETLGDPRVGILWDPGNSVFSGWAKAPYPAEYAAGRPFIRHIHVKDPRGQQEYVRLGDGDVPWPDILGQLRADGYRGWVSLETHWRIGRVLSPEQRDVPWGRDFSADGFEASVECMRRLSEMVSS
ncbi:hypothetical protein VT50_0222945 [Streptomyces antioxidans]|uniref:Xylose isomerase-like TIM barrel domain-containing protein n=1 Tax=Streptomyces antioxidans TaxID=1507734 RepID=A0A1V4D155_9ACTN|nr:sugar phosphate isomerase/epimerase family protein [Streptomyces antioxidans]OPF76706.1 hypothetical protein VT50_0222945 [Streptomyces antioxidans]